MLSNEGKVLNIDEEKYINEKIFKNRNERYIYYIKKYMEFDNYKYDINELNNKLISNKLNIEVNNTVEAIKFINKKNWFKYLSLTANKDNIEKLEIPLYVIEKEWVKTILQDELNNQKLECKKILLKENDNSNIGQIFAVVDSYYCISYLKKDNEYIIAIYNTDNSDSVFKQLNFIEVYSILANISLKEAVVQLIKLLCIKVKCVQEYISIYYSNIEILEDIKTISKYNYFYKKAIKHLYLLKELNKLAINETYFNVIIENMGNIYCSQRYIAKTVLKDKLKRNTISLYLNAFALMGFYKKILSNETKNMYNDTTVYQFYLINEDLLINANEVAMVMFNNKKSLSDIDKKYIIENYGIEIANTIIFARSNNLKGGGICA